MNQHISIYRSQFEDGIALENADGNRLELVVVHLPGDEPTFHVAHMTPEQQETGEFTELFSCPVEAA